MTQTHFTLPFESRVLLSVPYAEKEAAKKLGASFDGVLKRWWVDRSTVAMFPGLHR